MLQLTNWQSIVRMKRTSFSLYTLRHTLAFLYTFREPRQAWNS